MTRPLVAAALVAALVPAPAEGAPEVLVLVGTITYTAGGGPASDGSASFSVYGSYGGAVSGPVTYIDSVSLCPASATVWGSMSGTMDLPFVWSRVGSALYVTTGGDFPGSGTGQQIPPGPGACGSRTTDTVVVTVMRQ